MKDVLLPPEFTDRERQILEFRDRLNTPVVDSGFAESLVEAYKEAEATSLRTLESLDDAICREMLAEESLEDASLRHVSSGQRGQRNINVSPPSKPTFGIPQGRSVFVSTLAGALLAFGGMSLYRYATTTERPTEVTLAMMIDS